MALGSAAIGAGGSILSQVVGGIVTSRREKKKAEADERRWQIESDAKRRDRNLDHKIALFSKFLASMEGIQRTEDWAAPRTEATWDSYEQTLNDLREVVEEIGLIAPDVYRHATSTFISFSQLLFAKLDSGYAKGDRAAVRAADTAELSLDFWVELTRIAIRSYISHEDVEWPEQAIAEHERELKGDADTRRSVYLDRAVDVQD